MSDQPTPEPPTSDSTPETPERMDLPKWNRARVKRAQAPGDPSDPFQQGVRRAGRGALRRGPLVALGVVALAGLIAGGVAWAAHRRETAAEATRALAEALSWRARGVVVPDMDEQLKDRVHPTPVPVAHDQAEVETKVDQALAALDTRGNDRTERLALLVRGAKQAQAAEYALAEQSFREFLKAVGNGHDLAFLAQEGLALALEGQGQLEGALAECEPLLGAKGSFYRDQGLYQKGRLLEAVGRKDDALAVYRQYAEEYPLDAPSLAQAEVTERLKDLDPAFVVPGTPDQAWAGGS